jgi:hypothetical protein
MNLDRIPDTVAPIEVLWTLVALMALLLHFWAGQDARQDLRSLNLLHAPPLRLIAQSNIAVAYGLGYIQVVFVVIGIRAMTLPSPTPTGDPDVGAVLAGVAFIGAELILAGISWLSVYVRRRARELSRLELQNEAEGGE